MKHHKHPLLRIEQIKLQVLLAIRQDVTRNWRQYVLMKAALNNVAVDFKPDILQDTVDLAAFFGNYQGRMLLHRFRPECRPILNRKLYSLTSQTALVKKEITR